MVHDVKHTHHIVPKYEGGSDDPSNLVELTVTQHAMWHFAEWQRKKNKEDFIAWKSLSNTISKAEKVRLLSGLGGSKSKGRVIPEEVKEKLRKPRPSGRGYKWWHNPRIQQTVRSKEWPGEGWVRGRGQAWAEESSRLRSLYWKRVKS